MSSVYHVEPPTRGKVIFHTTYGAIDVELWSKEAPRACRNFVQLALEGYYDRTCFHRVIPGFMAQGGDPTGTGEGGDSVWGKPFSGETHARIRFNHRGQLAMANENRPDTNRAQFFFTLDACSWLDGKHTIFGTVAGNTVFNLLRMGEAEIGDGDRPTEVIELKTVEVLDNPFDDVVPRDLAKGEREAKEKAEAARKAAKKAASVKNLGLLSFGEEQEAQDVRPKSPDSSESDSDDGGAAPAPAEGALKAALSSRAERRGDADAKDFAAKMRDRLRQRAGKVAAREKRDAAAASKRRRDAVDEDGEFAGVDDDFGGGDARKLREAKDAAKAERKRLRAKEAKDDKLREAKAAKDAALVRSSLPAPTRLTADAKRADAAQEKNDMLTPFEALRQKNKRRAKTTKGRESDTLARLAAFSSSLKTSKSDRADADAPPAAPAMDWLDGDDDDDDDADWFAGKLKFRKHTDDLFRTGGDGRSADDYLTLDPREKPKSYPGTTNSRYDRPHK
ncbi:peptidyl-prolyl cis-trans isomerase [Aureococcus anophagefferens]|uniref:Peptidyl-prolyl cis-trans isomerase n=1 Tax=Aureococcus anophagefferens TaxID=44056 RepID=A0ABR1FY18_AURAN